MSRWLTAALALGVVLLTIAPAADAQRRRRDRERTSEASASEGTLVLQSTQEGAEVLVDEQSVGRTPLAPLALAPGSHTLRVRLPGHTEYSDVVQITAGQATEIPVELFPLSQVLAVTTVPPGAHVYVDGNFMGTTPVELDLLEGTHSVRIVSTGYEEAIREVEARAGSRDALELELVALPEGAGERRPTQWFEEPVTWIAIGGGAVAIAVVIAVVAVATSGGPGQIDQFCGLPGGCIRVDTSW